MLNNQQARNRRQCPRCQYFLSNTAWMCHSRVNAEGGDCAARCDKTAAVWPRECPRCQGLLTRSSWYRHHAVNASGGDCSLPAKEECPVCGKLLYQAQLKKHESINRSGGSCLSANNPGGRRGELNCGACDKFRASSMPELLGHLTSDHYLHVPIKQLDLASETAFEEWKRQLEVDTSSRFRKSRIRTFKGGSSQHFLCNRSGRFKSIRRAGSSKEKFKTATGQISKKIGFFCSAYIKAVYDSLTGKVSIRYCDMHYGHTDGAEPSSARDSVSPVFEVSADNNVNTANEVEVTFGEQQDDSRHEETQRLLDRLYRATECDADALAGDEHYSLNYHLRSCCEILEAATSSASGLVDATQPTVEESGPPILTAEHFDAQKNVIKRRIRINRTLLS